VKIDPFVMADTLLKPDVCQCAPIGGRRSFPAHHPREMIMIAALAFTLVAVALGLPGLAVLVMLGLTQYDEKQPSRDRTPGRSAKRHFLSHGGT
jgi:hypothetical protein